MSSRRRNPTPPLPTTDAERLEVLEDVARSGLSFSAYARESGYSVHTLRAWSTRLRDQVRSDVEQDFLEVDVLPDATPNAGDAFAELLVGGITVRVRPGFAGDELRRLVEVLRSC